MRTARFEGHHQLSVRMGVYLLGVYLQRVVPFRGGFTWHTHPIPPWLDLGPTPPKKAPGTKHTPLPPPPSWTEWLTDSCENIIFWQLRWWKVTRVEQVQAKTWIETGLNNAHFWLVRISCHIRRLTEIYETVEPLVLIMEEPGYTHLRIACNDDIKGGRENFFGTHANLYQNLPIHLDELVATWRDW